MTSRSSLIKSPTVSAHFFWNCWTCSLQEGVAPLRLERIKEALKANPKIKLVAIEDASWDTVKSQTIASQLFARFAGQGGLQAVYGMADNQAVAIINAAEAAGISVGSGANDLIVVGSNCVPKTVAAIRSGKLYSSGTQLPTFLGKRAAEAVAIALIARFYPQVAALGPAARLTNWRGLEVGQVRPAPALVSGLAALP